MAKFDTTFAWLAAFFVFIGALNWGLVGIFDFNVVTALFGTGVLTKITYVLIGFFALYWGYSTFCEGRKS